MSTPAATLKEIHRLRRFMKDLQTRLGEIPRKLQSRKEDIAYHEDKRERALKMGIKDPRKRYDMEDMVRGDCLFSATGVTTGRIAVVTMTRADRARGRGDRAGEPLLHRLRDGG